MRWESGWRSTNVEDRRGMSGAGMVGGGGIGMLILVLIISFISGRNPLELLEQVEQVPAGEREYLLDAIGAQRRQDQIAAMTMN